MCYAIPGRVTAIDNKTVTVDYFGETKKALNELDNLGVGDYIYAQGGFVITKVSESEALSTLSTWKELFFELQEQDLRLSRMDLEKAGLARETVLILDRALEERPLRREELLTLLTLDQPEDLAYLYKAANFLRQKNLGNSCCVHGIIEFSNICSADCFYCGISTGNRDVNRYRMTKDEILRSVREANDLGFQALVLQSGEGCGYSPAQIADIIRSVKKEFDVLIFISVGETGLDSLKTYYDAGARGLLMRFETSNASIYGRLHSGRTLASRLDHLKEANRLGYLILTGGLIGLPGQKPEDILNDILLTKELNAEMYSFGPFLPAPGTKLASCKTPATDDVLKVLAVSRIVDPKNAKILVTTAFETLDPKAREKGLMAGANSVMLNVTPSSYRKDYEIYPNRAWGDVALQDQIEKTITLLRSLGRAPTDLGVSDRNG